MDGDKYVPGAIALAKSVKKHMSDIATVCMITDDVPTVELIHHFDEIVEVEKICVTNTPKVGGHKAGIVYTWNSYSPTKWNVLGLDSCKYEKVLFMDADMIVLAPIYEVFDLPTPAAVFDHQLSKEYVMDARWLGDRSGGGGFINHYKEALGMVDSDHLEGGIPIPSASIDRLRSHPNT
jgi:alpha-N-acetylglucosamine transferase